MDKEKLVQAGIWLSITVLIIFIDANLLFIGFNHLRHDSYTVIIIAIIVMMTWNREVSYHFSFLDA